MAGEQSTVLRERMVSERGLKHNRPGKEVTRAECGSDVRCRASLPLAFIVVKS